MIPDDYIPRKAAIKVILTSTAPYIELSEMPAANVVEVRHGRWIWDGDKGMYYYCSCCHHNAYGCITEILEGKYRYCPSCGAKMDEGQDDV